MRSLRTAGHLLLVTLLGIPLITPLLRWTSVPCTHDGHLHVHRIAALRHAWHNGILFSQWVPDLAFGYGYPFFIYREPGPLYAVLLPHLLGLPLPAASNLFYALTILAAGWFMFLWVRDVLGARAGVVSAVAYMAAPYLLLDALVRGNAPESMALPLFPFLLWVGRRWVISGSVPAFLLSVAGLALLSLSHNISTLIFVPTLLVYLAAIAGLHHLRWKTALGRLALVFMLGLGMTIFYTGGALLEMDQVTLEQSTVTRNNDFRFNFASIAEMLAPVSMEDPSLLNPPLPIRLGWVPLLLALAGATSPVWNQWLDREQRWHALLMSLAVMLYLFMALPLSRALWENLPLIDFVQFPWRFIGRAALPLAFLAGMPFMTAPREKRDQRRDRLASLAAVCAVALLLLEALPALYPRYCEEDPYPTIVDVHAYEAATGLVGVDPEGSYFPRTVLRRPKESPLQTDYVHGQTPQRFDRTALPPGAMADVDYNTQGAVVTLETPVAFTARYLSFAFPGWSAAVDGHPVPITPSDPAGLITFPIPAGEHQVTIRWGSTPLRSALALATLLAVTGVVVASFALWPAATQKNVSSSPLSLDRVLVPGLIAVGVGLLLFKVLLVDNDLTPLRQSSEPPVAAPARLAAGELLFAGHTLSQEEVAAGETFDIDLAWITTAPISESYQSNIWLAGSDGLLWSDKETQRPRLYEDGPATWERETGQWAWDSREVRVLPGTPPGRYDLVLTLFDRQTLQPLSFVDQPGTVIGPTAVIGQIDVVQPATPATFEPQYPLQVPLEDSGLVLLGFNQDRGQAAPGDDVLLTFFLEKTAGHPPQQLSIQLRDEQGQNVHTWFVPLIAHDFDSALWSEGQRLRGQHLLRIPAALAGGTYRLFLQNEIPLAGLEVVAPARVFSPPPSAVTLAVPFGEEISLAGYTLRSEEGGLVVELVWSALQEIVEPYHVFVHLVDSSGNLLAQSDAQPASWTRPATGWLPGEFVLDRHLLPIPVGVDRSQLRLLVGLYDPATGERLRTTTGDAVELPLESG